MTVQNLLRRDLLRDFEHLLENRPFNFNGIASLVWPIADDGAWTGPKADWENNHSKKYFDHVRHKRVVVTAGGNCGMYARLYAQMFEHVYVFEPDPLNFHCLVVNNQLNNVYKLQAAVGDKNGRIRVRRGPDVNCGTHTVESHPEAAIPLMTIDSLDLDVCDLIQLDIEGYEIHALRGAIDTIRRHQPVVICENAGHSSDVQHFMAAEGYAIVDHSSADTIYVYRPDDPA
jgi:FkbM family methyltransferase